MPLSVDVFGRREDLILDQIMEFAGQVTGIHLDDMRHAITGKHLDIIARLQGNRIANGLRQHVGRVSIA